MTLKAISLFTGVGGLDFGFEAAGFETAVALDLDAVACRAVRANRSWPVIEGDLTHIESSRILSVAALKAGEADILIGGPPCQPFSKSAYWASGDAKRMGDPRARTLSEYMRVLRDTRPRAFLLENVMGLGFSGKSEGLDYLRGELDRVNASAGTSYSCSIMALNAADFGVPQLRERLFVIGARDGTRFEFPEPAFGPREACLAPGVEPYRTCWDALHDCPDAPAADSLRMTGKWADLLPSIPEGQNYLWHTARGGGSSLFGWRTRYWNFMLKLSKSKPAWTIQAQPGPATGPFHWKNRKLSPTEMARLQTFPDGLEFDCSHQEAQRLIGNAVPSALAEVLALEIRRQLLSAPLNRSRPTLAPSSQGVPPPCEPTVPLSSKYWPLIGSHDDHPGTGRGRGAVARTLQAA